MLDFISMLDYHTSYTLLLQWRETGKHLCIMWMLDVKVQIHIQLDNFYVYDCFAFFLICALRYLLEKNEDYSRL